MPHSRRFFKGARSTLRANRLLWMGPAMRSPSALRPRLRRWGFFGFRLGPGCRLPLPGVGLGGGPGWSTRAFAGAGFASPGERIAGPLSARRRTDRRILLPWPAAVSPLPYRCRTPLRIPLPYPAAVSLPYRCRIQLPYPVAGSCLLPAAAPSLLPNGPSGFREGPDFAARRSAGAAQRIGRGRVGMPSRRSGARARERRGHRDGPDNRPHPGSGRGEMTTAAKKDRPRKPRRREAHEGGHACGPPAPEAPEAKP